MGTGATTKVLEAGLERWLHSRVERRDFFPGVWFHCHPGTSATPSGTDWSCLYDFVTSDPPAPFVMVIGTQKEGVNGRDYHCTMRYPMVFPGTGPTFMDIPLQVKYEDRDLSNLGTAAYDEVAFWKEVQERLVRPTFQGPQYSQGYYGPGASHHGYTGYGVNDWEGGRGDSGYEPLGYTARRIPSGGIPPDTTTTPVSDADKDEAATIYAMDCWRSDGATPTVAIQTRVEAIETLTTILKWPLEVWRDGTTSSPARLSPDGTPLAFIDISDLRPNTRMQIAAGAIAERLYRSDEWGTEESQLATQLWHAAGYMGRAAIRKHLSALLLEDGIAVSDEGIRTFLPSPTPKGDLCP